MNRMALVVATDLCAGLFPACAIGLAWMQARSARQAVERRVVWTIATHRPATMEQGGDGLMHEAVQRLPVIQIEKLFGFDRARRTQYRLSLGVLLSLTAAIGLAVSLTGLYMFGLAGSVPGPIIWVFLSRLYYRRCDKRRTDLLFRQFPDALSMIVRAVRVGLPLSRAVTSVAEECQAPTSIEFKQLSEEVTIGLPLPDALRALAARNQLGEYRFFAAALALQSQTGGGLAETLETLADTIRKRVAAKLKGRALASEARASCYVLGALPFIVGLLLCVVSPSYMAPLFTTRSGLKLLGLAVGSLSAGIYLMNLITRRALG